MPRQYKMYLQDIVEASLQIEDYTHNLSRKQFESDQMRLDAVLHR